MVMAALASSVWWFLRNEHLYGDLTARSGVRRLGLEFPALGTSPSAVAHLGQSAVVYLTLPVEYYRNLVQAPPAIEAGAALLVLAVGLVGSLRLMQNRTTASSLVIGVGLLSVSAWAATALVVQAVAFRTAYPVLVLWAASAASLLEQTDQRRTRVAALAVVLTLLALHLWVISQILHTPYPPGLVL